LGILILLGYFADARLYLAYSKWEKIKITSVIFKKMMVMVAYS